MGDSGSWTDGPQDETGTTAAISALTADTEYQVQVRATNAEGDGAWSPSGTGSTGSTSVPTVYVSFEQGTYTVDEGSSVTVTVELSADPERSVMISISRTNQDGADEDDYFLPASVTLDSGQTSQMISFNASVDTVDDDGESVTLGFDKLPPGVSAGTTNVATVSITDVLTVDVDAPPDAPQNLSAQAGDERVVLRWDDPADPTITAYPYRYSHGGYIWEKWTILGSVTTVEVDGLTNDIEYTFEVRAFSNKASPASQVTATPNAGSNAGNNEPVISDATLTRTVPENSAANQNVGAVIPAATDADGDSLTYTMEGADAASFTFEASVRQIQTKTGVTYDYETTESYSVTVKADDGNGGDDTIAVTINVTDVDEAPAAPDAPAVSPVSGSTTSLDVSWTAPGNTGKPAITSYDLRYRVGSSGSWTDGPQDETGTTAAITGLTAGTEYQVQVRASNDEGDSGWSAASTGSTDAEPIITTTSRLALTYRENGTATLHTFRATDPESSAIAWSVTGTDEDYFTISETGVLSFASPPDYESPTDSGSDNVYEVTVVARDDAFNSDTLDVAVTVTDQDEGPEISGQQSLSFTENQATERVLATYSATDPEDPSASITRWSLTGTDAGDFTIDESGQLTFRNAPDHERPADSGRDNVYNLSVRASDGRNYGYLEVTVTVQDVNEPPAVTGTDTFTFRENGTADLHTFRATDPESSAIAWSVTGTDEDYFAIGETGVLSFASPPNYESPTDSGSDNVYEVTVVARDDASNSDTLDVAVTVTDQNEGPEISGQQSLFFPENQATDRVLAFYFATDPEDPSASITRWSLTGTDAGDFTIDESGQLTFRNAPDHERPADSGRDNVYNLSVRASDGRNYGYLEVTVTVEDVNEPPTITTIGRASFTYRENGTATLHTFRATDPERSSIAWSVTGTDEDYFAISETGVLSFPNPPNYESPTDSGSDNVYEVTVVARDDASNSDTLDVAGTTGLSFTENQATERVLATYTGRDPEDPGAPVTRWSLTGADAGDFAIDESGRLTFRNVPDHERPADSGSDNVYNLSVRASDGRNYGYLEVTVTVQDVNEPPTITTIGRASFTYRENGKAPLYTFRATDPERGNITWSLSGADADDFTISETGVLSFANPPDYENPTDSGRDNVYEPTFPIWLNIPLSKSSAFFKPLSICETLAVGMAIITP